ncbi:hypothetical protein [Azospirillum argentinense]|uniref:hypothetical protein n=1 Tax=Azospirillum argentinense TaxID=2970906 RepID=UPI0032DFEC2E
MKHAAACKSVDESQFLRDAEPVLAADMLEGADQIAAFMGLSARQVYHLQGRLPVFSIGAKLFARKSTIVHWIAEQEAKATGATI